METPVQTKVKATQEAARKRSEELYKEVVTGTHDVLTSEDIEFVQAALAEDAPDFARRVAPVYKILDWQWVRRTAPPYVPDEVEILETLLVLIHSMSSQTGQQNAGGMTGGLNVWASTESQGGACAYGIEMTIGTKYREISMLDR